MTDKKEGKRLRQGSGGGELFDNYDWQEVLS